MIAKKCRKKTLIFLKTFLSEKKYKIQDAKIDENFKLNDANIFFY